MAFNNCELGDLLLDLFIAFVIGSFFNLSGFGFVMIFLIIAWLN